MAQSTQYYIIVILSNKVLKKYLTPLTHAASTERTRQLLLQFKRRSWTLSTLNIYIVLKKTTNLVVDRWCF